MEVGRFAPSTTGPAHPGTLLAALLAWLDIRSRGGRILLRLEDLDPERCKPQYAEAMLAALDWLGLDWDGIYRQSAQRAAHAASLDALAAADLLYPCACSRARLRSQGRVAPDGGAAYPNTCRGRKLPAAGWRACAEPLRVRLPDGVVRLRDEGGADLSQTPAESFGDPVVRRRDGAIAYNLAVVVDDAGAGVTRVVRGRDIAPSTALQVAIQGLLGLPRPVYRHHLLLLEPHGAKLAKFHGAVGWEVLRRHYSAPELCGLLAQVAGLHSGTAPCRPRDLLADFSWARVKDTDAVLAWDGTRLSHRAP